MQVEAVLIQRLQALVARHLLGTLCLLMQLVLAPARLHQQERTVDHPLPTYPTAIIS
jgi:hypothetical protein